MNINDIEKKHFLRHLKDPELMRFQDAIKEIRERIPHMYMKLIKPTLHKNTKGVIRKISLYVQLPRAYTPLELRSYSYFLQDTTSNALHARRIPHSFGETEHDELAHTITLRVWIE